MITILPSGKPYLFSGFWKQSAYMLPPSDTQVLFNIPDHIVCLLHTQNIITRDQGMIYTASLLEARRIPPVASSAKFFFAHG